MDLLSGKESPAERNDDRAGVLRYDGEEERGGEEGWGSRKLGSSQERLEANIPVGSYLTLLSCSQAVIIDTPIQVVIVVVITQVNNTGKALKKTHKLTPHGRWAFSHGYTRDLILRRQCTQH